MTATDTATRLFMKSRVRICAAAIVILLEAVVTTGQVRDFRPVTEASLLNPDPADWPSWRRTLDGWGYSPLKQIDTRNVREPFYAMCAPVVST
jgi:alcohol dehydrogenase (cytochrome c)